MWFFKKSKKFWGMSVDNVVVDDNQSDIKSNEEKEFFETMDGMKNWLDVRIHRFITPDIAEIYSLAPEIACKLIIAKINCWEQLSSIYSKLKDIWFIRDKSLCKLIRDYCLLNDVNDLHIDNTRVFIRKDVFFSQIGSIKNECKKLWLVVPLDDSSKKILKYWPIWWYVKNSVSAIQKYYFLNDLKKVCDLPDLELNYGNLDDSVYYILKALSKQKKICEYGLDDLSKSIINVFNDEFQDFYESSPLSRLILPVLKWFFQSIIKINNLWLDIVSDKTWLKYIVKQIFYESDVDYDESSLDKSYEDLLWNWSFHNSNNWFFSCRHMCFFWDLSNDSQIHFIRDRIKDQSKSINGDKFGKNFTRDKLIEKLKSFFGEKVTERMMNKIDDNNCQNSKNWLIDLEILMSLLYYLWEEDQPTLFSKSFYRDPEKKYIYSVSNFLANRKHWLSEWASDVYKNHWNIAAWVRVMEVAIIFIMIWVIQNNSISDFKNEKHNDSLRNIFEKPHELNNLISFYKILLKYGLDLYGKQWLIWLLMAEFSPSLLNWTLSWFMKFKNDFVKKLFWFDNDKVISKIVYCWIWDSFENHRIESKNKYWELYEKNEKKQKRRKNFKEILPVIWYVVLMLLIWLAIEWHNL